MSSSSMHRLPLTLSHPHSQASPSNMQHTDMSLARKFQSIQPKIELFNLTENIHAWKNLRITDGEWYTYASTACRGNRGNRNADLGGFWAHSPATVEDWCVEESRVVSSCRRTETPSEHLLRHMHVVYVHEVPLASYARSTLGRLGVPDKRIFHDRLASATNGNYVHPQFPTPNRQYQTRICTSSCLTQTLRSRRFAFLNSNTQKCSVRRPDHRLCLWSRQPVVLWRLFRKFTMN